MTHVDSTHLLETAPERGEPDQPAWVTPTSRYLTADLPILAMALMLTGGGAAAKTPGGPGARGCEPFDKPARQK